MRKTALLGMSALAIGLAVTPINTQAAGYINYGSLNGNRKIVVSSKECSSQQLKDILNSLKGNGNCIVTGGSIGDENCTIVPPQPENGGNNNGGGGNGGNEDNSPDNSQKPETDNEVSRTYARQVVNLVNEERAKEGLAPLTVDEQTGKAATVRAKEIQTNFSHTRPNGSSFSTVLSENQVSYRGAGENIAWGQKTPEEVVTGWMNSPGHRANIMNKDFTSIGVGNLADSAGTMYWVQLFTY